MRAIYIFYIFLFITFYGCTTVEIAKEVTKASDRVKTTIKNITDDSNKNEEVEKNEYKKFEKNIEKTENFSKEKENIIIKKKKEEAKISKQKKISTINIKGKTLKKLTQDFGEPDFIRKDGNTKTVRFNASSCRLFVYFNLKEETFKVKYFEIRNINGELIDKKEKINKCFKEIKKV